MIVEKKYCKKCGYETLHSCSKPDYWHCIRCSNSLIEKFEINESEIDRSSPSYYLYIDSQYVYFFDIFDVNVAMKMEIKKLLNHEVLRIPFFRVKN